MCVCVYVCVCACVCFSVSNVLSQFTMLLMLLSLSLGWTLASAHSVCRYSHFRSLAQRPAAHLVGGLGLLQVRWGGGGGQ